MNRREWLDRVMDHSRDLEGKNTSAQSMIAVASVLACRYANAKGTAYPSAETVGRSSGLSERAARRAIHALAEAGWLKKVRRRRASVEWRLVVPHMTDLDSESGQPDRSQGDSGSDTCDLSRVRSVTCDTEIGHKIGQPDTQTSKPLYEPQLASLLPPLSEPGLTDDEIEAAIDWRIETRDPSKGPIKDPSRYRAWLRAEWTRDTAEAREVLAQRQRAIDEESERRSRVEERERQLRELEQRAPDHLAPLLERAAKSAQVPRYRRPTKPGRTQARSEPRRAPIPTRIDSQADPATNRPRRAPA